ncbi:MAG: hypothetical protein BWY82_02449 [Verrucomicrobia bacterium ADurb.Bin474]|nr:MAG: hypothetical protein BWY82_02449 [Verrucomicrobia bacterium ADurb.Bin474]
MLRHLFRESADDLGVEQGFPIGIEKHRKRHPPRPLTRDTPVGPVFHCTTYAVFSPLRNPPDRFDLVEDLVSHAFEVQTHKELIHGPEYHGRLRSPTMRVLVVKSLYPEKSALFLKNGQYRLICRVFPFGFKNGLTNQISRDLPVIDIASVVVQRTVDFQTIAEAGLVVLESMPGSGVHTAGSGVECDILRIYHRAEPVNEGMLGLEAFEACAGDGCIRYSHACRIPSAILNKGFSEFLRHQIVASFA